MKRVLVVIVLCVSVLIAAAGPPPPPGDAQTAATQAKMTPISAFERLKEGNVRFASNKMKPRDLSANVSATAADQFPFAAVLGCMDSRVPTELVFDQTIGDVFGVRVAGNVVNDDELGSLEFAVKSGAKLIVVLGHTGCGAVKGAIDDVKLGNLTALLEKIRPAVAEAKCTSSKDDACVNKAAELNVRESMKQIREKSPYLRNFIDYGKVGFVGAIYDVATGKVTFLKK